MKKIVRKSVIWWPRSPVQLINSMLLKFWVILVIFFCILFKRCRHESIRSSFFFLHLRSLNVSSKLSKHQENYAVIHYKSSAFECICLQPLIRNHEQFPNLKNPSISREWGNAIRTRITAKVVHIPLRLITFKYLRERSQCCQSTIPCRFCTIYWAGG